VRDGVATGFQFAPVTAEALGFAIERAVELYADQARWQAMQRRAMTRKVDWSVPAEAYLDLYRELVPAAAPTATRGAPLRVPAAPPPPICPSPRSGP
jgi:glycogen synthase